MLAQQTAPLQRRLDRDVSRSAVERMAAQLNARSLEIIPGAGHTGWRAHEEHILQALLD
jgi:pimeloyl-ACP methyl ester carboxylesterase